MLKERNDREEDRKMTRNINELSEKDMFTIGGGTGPGEGVDFGDIDDIINGNNYDAIADWINNKLSPPRTRKVRNDCEIYDVDV